MNIEILIQVIVYILIIITAGIFIGKKAIKNKNTILTTSSLIAGFVMTHYGAGFILGGAELGYKYGLYGIAYGLGAAIGVLLLGFIFNKSTFKKIKNNKIKSIPQFLYYKYQDKKILTLSSILSIFALLAIASAQIFSIIGILNLIGLPGVKLGTVITLIVAFIASKGINNIIKFGKINILILSVGLTAALIFMFSINIHLSPVTVSYQSLSLWEILAIILPAAMYTLIGQDFHQKTFLAKSINEIRLSGIISFIVLIALGLIPVLLGMKASFIQNLDSSMAIPGLIIQVMPNILNGLLIAAILAAVIGSTQAVISAAISNILEDKTINLKIRSKSAYNESIFAFILSFLALLIAIFSNKGIIGLLILGYTIYTAGMFIPVIFAFFSSKTLKLKNSIIWSSLVGILIVLIFELGIIKTQIPSIIFAVLGSLIFFVVTIGKLQKKSLKVGGSEKQHE